VVLIASKCGGEAPGGEDVGDVRSQDGGLADSGRADAGLLRVDGGTMARRASR
jgi:hypothetical protein